ncbi:MAG: HAMP domain-containing histidine kinase [Thiotrichales bacterium]|nr:HAMP domain-containing histidine kinase [Thiotrichales bacterium]
MNRIISMPLLAGAIIVSAGVIYTYDRMTRITEQGTGGLYSISESIHNLRQLDGEWSLAVLHSLVTDSDFDKVAGFLPRLRELRSGLTATVDTENTIPSKLRNRLFQFLSLIESKEEIVEQFKTNFAVVRNSRKFLPIVTRSLLVGAAQIDAPKTEEGKKAIVSTAGKELVDKIRDIGDRVLSFSQHPSEGKKVRVLTLLSELEKTVFQYSPELSDTLNNYISHSRIIMERTTHLNSILKRILETEISETGAKLSGQFKNISDSLVAKTNENIVDLGKQLLIMTLGLAIIVVVTGIFYSVSVFNFNKKLKSYVTKATATFAKNTKNNVDKPNLGANMSLVSSMANTIAEKLNAPVGKLSESLEAIHSDSKRFDLLKIEIGTIIHTKYTDMSEMIDNLKRIGEILNVVGNDTRLNDAPEAIDGIHDNIMHVQALADQLRNLGDVTPKPKAWFNINDTVTAAIEEIKDRPNDNITIKAKASTVPQVFGSHEEMQNIVESLLSNAIDAIKSARKIKGQITISTKRHNNQAIIISVIDNGKGMNNETRNRVFEPFYSTKKRGGSKISGLGLSVAQKLVIQNGGKITINSILGKGTNFSIVLPL